jgi:hypothetical protein
VDDLDSIGALERNVSESAAMLLLLGSLEYFSSANCKREVAAAQKESLPLILVHDADKTKHGWPLVVLKAACSEAHRPYVFNDAHGDARRVVPWHRTRDHQLVSLRLIAEHLLRASPAYGSEPTLSLSLPGEISDCALRFDMPTRVWVSEANEGARTIAEELISISSMLSLVPAPVAHSQRSHPSTDEASAEPDATFLLYLNKDTFADERLAADVQLVLSSGPGCGGKIVMAHENDPDNGGCAFDTLLQATPQQLIDEGLYAPLAIALHAGEEHRVVSMRLLAVALGARIERSRGCADSAREWAGALVETTVKLSHNALDRFTSHRSQRRSAGDTAPCKADVDKPASTEMVASVDPEVRERW